MKKILTIGASSSRNSINRQLAQYTASLVTEGESIIVDLNDFEMPIFSVDRENESGIPQPAKDFQNLIKECDAIIISLAEHNGSYSTAFKNILDWSSRLEGKLWNDSTMFLLATSPGGRGASSVLSLANSYFPYLGGKIVASFSLPSFYDNFSADDGITDADLAKAYEEELEKFRSSIL